MTQHRDVSVERWSAFSLDEQILMIANEMNRGTKLMRDDDRARRKNCYERVLRLTDLTIGAQRKRTLLKELLRWRDLVAAFYVAERADTDTHRRLLRALLYFTPTASRQIAALGLRFAPHSTQPGPRPAD